MFSRSAAVRELACPECQSVFSSGEALFLCPDPACPALQHAPEDVPERCQGRPVFRPRNYAEVVRCPYSPHTTFFKFCPRCGSLLPAASGSGLTVAIVGSTISGKTCFTTALVRQINKELPKETRQEMSLEWDDEPSKQYFKDLEKTIFRRGELPQGTKPETLPKSLRVTIRFTVRGLWRRLRHGRYSTVSLIFPDPAGEFFDSLQSVYTQTYLGNARAYILMVDPYASEEYAAWRAGRGQPLPDLELTETTETLRGFVSVLRRQLQQPAGPLDRALAVTLTKCDEEGLFDPDHPDYTGQFPVQGRCYDRRLARAIGTRVARHLQDDLGMSELVALAHQSFRHVEYFATSALGQPPERDPQTRELTGRVHSPRPRRVEEPLLWALHKWGYL
jgi:hypothetical protein